MDVRTGDERELLARTFNEMVPQLEDRMYMRQALEVAKEVQQNLLPEGTPGIPGFDIAATSVYCDETGGDYYDFFPFGNSEHDQLGIVIGDVTGHGVAAALLMATARALIRSLSLSSQSLAECLTRVNNLLTTDIRQTGNFMSLFFLAVAASSRTVRWVRAGHDPGILFDPKTGSFTELKGPGLVLGVEEDYPYEERVQTVETPGTIIFLGTDGIWEAHNADGEMFGKERLHEIIRKNADKPPFAIQNAVLESLRIFRGDAPQEDDITLVVIKVV
jgi:sigma-B regulation protein RsbU (phosphoserine phosphatase)